MNTTPTPRISIIGAGPGGLTCARILQKHGIDVTVYDRDLDADARNQGGSLDLHADDGQLALREAGLIQQFWKLARPEGQQMRRWDTAGNTLLDQIPDEDDLYKPEIDRGQLRDLLLSSLAPGTVQWGRTLASVAGPAEGPRILHFTDGTSVETDLVIGADGAFSRVRPAVSAAVPYYSGVTFTEAWFDDVENRHADLSALVGNGSATATDGDRALFAQRNSGGHIRVYIIRRAPADWITAAGLTAEDTAGIRAHLL
ncbi:FAD-dependent oxidoreductase, partial [Streptomyces sp. NPDC057052]|uniref:FAD-dependent oxidoreductase n=1 Tax=Streptomyces sp. NPDC057052 TaxID=3346010 RepID=UPI0036339654